MVLVIGYAVGLFDLSRSRNHIDANKFLIDDIILKDSKLRLSIFNVECQRQEFYFDSEPEELIKVFKRKDIVDVDFIRIS
jgi:hypothetical protein